LGKFWRVLRWKMLVDLMTILSILQSFSLFNVHLVYFLSFGIFYPFLECCSKTNLATLSTSNLSTG
jgi:hypothetical protein